MRYYLSGIFYSFLWASAAAATKFGLESVPPLVLANVRFMIAGAVMIVMAHFFWKGDRRFPSGKEWKPLIIFGLLNTTIYLGAYVYAMREVSAGIGSLATATNPLFILIISGIWLKRKIKTREVLGILLGISGILLATYPLLMTSNATIRGILILFFAMVAVSFATVYYSSVKWKLPALTINAWQVFIGGIALLPFTYLISGNQPGSFDIRFWASVCWLILPVSVIALQLWFYLLKTDPVKASLWLFLCPIFGFLIAGILFKEPITLYTIAGTCMVLAGLYLSMSAKPVKTT